MMAILPTDGTVLDLFCGGAGGWSLGMHRAGYRTVAGVEIDDRRRAVFERLFSVECIGRVMEADGGMT